MSFILDALKKSETERQQQAGGEFSNVPSSSGDSHPFKWLWILGLLLVFNFAVLIGIVIRDDEAPASGEAPPAAEEQPSPVADPATEPTFEEQIAEARQSQTQPIEEPAAAPAEQPAAAAAPVRSASRATSGARVPTFDELRLGGVLQIGDLHLDIHVYADDPAERFVFINMNKQREDSQLEEGPTVREITPDGVILEHEGSTFLLPRE